MSKVRRRFWFSAGAALTAGLLLRLWFIVHLPVFSGDSLIYGGIAKNWLQHGVYGFSSGADASITPTLIRLPGYPIFLAACFRLFGMEHYRAVMNVQAAFDLLTCWLASALACRLFGSRAALFVLWLAALCPFTANYVASPLTEPLVLTTIALAFYGFARWQDAGLGYNRWLWIVGAALAWSVMLRPEQGLLAAAVLPAMLWRALATRERRAQPIRSAFPVLAAALCVVLPLVPWTARNWRTFGVIQPLVPRYANDPGEAAPIGFGRWYRTWAIEFASTEEVYWNYDGEPIAPGDLPARAFDAGSPAATASLHDRTAALVDDYNQNTSLNADVDGRFSALAGERIHAHPVLYYVGLPVARLVDMALRPRVEMMDIALDWWNWSDHPGQTAFAASYAALNLAYLVAGVAGFVVWRRRGWRSVAAVPYRELAFAMAAGVLLRCALLLTIDNSEPRYTLEFFPILLVWSGALFAPRTPPTSAGEHGGR